VAGSILVVLTLALGASGCAEREKVRPEHAAYDMMEKRIRAMKPLSAKEGKEHVIGRTTFANADVALEALAKAHRLPNTSADRKKRAEALLANHLGLASLASVDRSAPLRIYHTRGERYFGRADLAVVKKQGSALPTPRRNHYVRDLGAHAAIDLKRMDYRLQEIEAYLREDLQREPPVDPYHLQWSVPEMDELPTPFSMLLPRSGPNTADRFHDYRCLAAPAAGHEGDEAGALLATGWYRAERSQSVQCFGRGRVVDYDDCAGYHDVNLFERLKPENPYRDNTVDTKLIMETLKPKAGMRIVDLGAGMGYFTFKLAPIVGDSGRIYATDSHPCAVRYLKTGALALGLTNVEVIHGYDVVSPYEKIDAFLMVNLHSIEAEIATRSFFLKTYARIHESLKPGGKVIIWNPSVRSNSIGRGEVVMQEPAELIDAMELMGFRTARVITEFEGITSEPDLPAFLVFEKKNFSASAL
jgi:tRNA A58 N-methylase Trm61